MSDGHEASADPSKLKQSSWKEYAIRFGFGGAITAATGVIAHAYGPVVGGLFLAFPAILPASVTLVQQHEEHRAAAVDALGAAVGGFGLVAFALAVWLLAPLLAAWLALVIAGACWLGLSTGLWVLLHRP